MDARELTDHVIKLEQKVADLIKRVEYLEQENQKIRLQLNDLDIDVAMLRR